jgi:hypothetical protein
MRTHLYLGICTLVIATAFTSVPTASGAGVVVGGSHLIGLLDYSDTFTGTDAGGKPSRPYMPAVQPPAAYLVENTYGKPSISFSIGAGFSFAADSAGTPGFIYGVPSSLWACPQCKPRGSNTGFI